jgi:ADP-heptose:LPS heptosyltransferase
MTAPFASATTSGGASAPERAHVRRIVVTRLRFLGDIVLSTPVLAALREGFPHASIEYLADSAYLPVLERHPALDRLHPLPRGSGPGQVLRVVRQLRQPRVDWWFDLFGNPRSAILTALSRPRHAVGPKRGLRSHVFQHRREGPSGDRSAVRHHLDMLVPLLGRVEPSPTTLYVGDDERAAIRDRLRLAAGEHRVLLHPGSTWPDKAWPESHWPDLVRRLREEGLGPFVVISPPDAPALAERIAAGAGDDVRVLPVLAVREVLALLTCCSLYVGNDGGVLHCAVALGVPTVGLFGPTEPDIWFPYEDRGPFRVVREYNPAGPCPDHGRSHVSRLAHLEVGPVVGAVRQVLHLSSKEVAGA